MAGRRARGARPAGRAADQHFLRSPRLAAELVRDASVGETDLVVEIGAGTGRLTAPLAERAGAVRAIELDPVLAAHLRRRFERCTSVDVVECDVLDVPLPTEPFRVLANLPFGSTTAILRRLLDDPALPLVRADLVVELGVACKRSRPWPSSLLNVYWGAWYAFATIRRLPRRCFEPAPTVDAGFLRIVRRELPLVRQSDARAFRALLEAAFAGDRVVRGPWLKRRARELGAEGALPAHELDAFQWAALFDAVRGRR